MKKQLFLFSIFLFITIVAVAVFSGSAKADGGAWVLPTGVLYYDSDLAYEGYNIVTPYKGAPSRFTYLVDMEGRIVHILKTDDETDHCATLTEQGTFLRNQGGAGRRFDSQLNEYDWDGNLIQQYKGRPGDATHPADGAHHSHWRMPNGNTLQIFYRSYLPAEAAAAGMVVSNWDSYHKPDIIIEFDPDGNIVWEWDTFQNMHAPGETDLAVRYAKVDPLARSTSTDWQHGNGVGYDPVRDWVYYKSGGSGFGEIWAIDHDPESPTYNDIIWRYGRPNTWNPDAIPPSATFDSRGRISVDYGDQTIFGTTHDTRWDPYSGNVSILLNSGFPDAPGSGVMVINPDTDEVEFSYPSFARGAYGFTQRFYSPRHASAQALPNGNWLINLSDNKLTREVTADGTIAWEFRSPFDTYQTECWDVGDEATEWGPHKLLRYGPDYPGLAGKTFNVDPPRLIAPQCTEVWKEIEADDAIRNVPTVTITAGDFPIETAVDVYVTVTGNGTYDVMAGFEWNGNKYYAKSTNVCLEAPDRKIVLAELDAPAGASVQVFNFTVPADPYGTEAETITVFAEVTNHGNVNPIADAQALLTIGSY